LDVRVLTRDSANAAHLADGIEIVSGDVRDPASLSAAVRDVDGVISAVHGFIGPRGTSPRTVDRDGNANLVEAAADVGADLVLVSVVGASPDNSMELFRMKHAAEQHALGSNVPTTIVRATAFLELWLDLLAETAARSGRPLVFGRGDNPINFVSVTDVAALVDHAATDRSTRGAIVEIGGPDNLTFNQLARAVQAANGRTRGPLHIPRPMLHLMAATVGRIKPQLGRQARAALAMDRENLTFDARAIRKEFPDLPCTALNDVLAAARAV
jgi:NADH dehydrogenase